MKKKKEELKEYEEQLKQLQAKNKELLDKVNHYDYLISAYHICFEGALGAIQALLKENCNNPSYWAKVAKIYLSYRYEEREKGKEIYDKHFQALEQKLERIRSIIEELKNFKEECGECRSWVVKQLEQVLQIIDEVE